MLLRKEVLDGIRAGTITLAFRRWRRPSVRSGGTLLTPAGQLSIGVVSRITLDQISAADARRAGAASRQALLELLGNREGEVYRIELGPLRPDPRIALRESKVTDPDELQKLIARLDNLDRRAPDGPWTRQVLALIHEHPGVRAGDLCDHLGQERMPFKLNVRKLKSLGLTESLKTGYRLSPRGEALRKTLTAPSKKRKKSR